MEFVISPSPLYASLLPICQDSFESIRGAHFVSGNWIITYPPHPALPALILASAKMFPQRCLKGRRGSYRRKTKELCTTPTRHIQYLSDSPAHSDSPSQGRASPRAPQSIPLPLPPPWQPQFCSLRLCFCSLDRFICAVF